MTDALVEAVRTAIAAQPGVEGTTVQAAATCTATPVPPATSKMRITGVQLLRNDSHSIRGSRTVSLPDPRIASSSASSDGPMYRWQHGSKGGVLSLARS
jgi:hypothetical protein